MNREIIQQLTSEMQEVFAESFEKIIKAKNYAEFNKFNVTFFGHNNWYNLVMRRNYKSKFNELTPIGWLVAGGVILIMIVIIIIGVLAIRGL